jgi:NodT family efflux transporter outer membrane factor (OMF) lipoprotein
MSAMRQTLLFLACVALLSGCAVGPNYHRPEAPKSTHFKEAEGWKPAEPREAASGTDWWSVYEDPVLDGLERQIEISNQTLKASEAAWREAIAVAQAAGAQLYPGVTLSASAERSRGAASSGASATGNHLATTATRPPPLNVFDLSAGASWDLDIWGKIRRTIESDVANAKASEADLAAARLSAQATLAIDYVQLRVTDEQSQLLADTITGYERALQITQNQYKVGVVAKADVITAQTQLDGARSQKIGLGVLRAQLEHAIAVLIGKPPAEFSLAPARFGDTIPVVPSGVPSALLERRPDISAAERKMAAANAQIGVAIAAYFPDLTLSGAYGFTSTVTAGLLKAPNNTWSVGAAASTALIDFGARRYQVAGARAVYDGTVATYRQTVLTAFQQVEDELAALRILEEQFQVADQTVKDANLAVTLALNQYKAGTVAYTAVVTAQAIALNDSQTLLNIRESRLVASVTLIQALGGGWSMNDLSAVHVARPTVF